MAAREDELESFVRDGGFVHVVLDGGRDVQQGRPLSEVALSANAVDRAVSGRGEKPGTRVGGDPLAGPARRRNRERLLGGFLGEIEIAEEADQAREDAAPFFAEDLLEDS
jgi:hypothetical protein